MVDGIDVTNLVVSIITLIVLAVLIFLLYREREKLLHIINKFDVQAFQASEISGRIRHGNTSPETGLAPVAIV